MTISIKDIAKKAGVAPSTVSRALHDHPRISPETTQAIKQLAQEMGYVPSAVARSLVSSRSGGIGLAVNDFLNPFYVDLISNIEDAVAEDSQHIFVGSFHRSRDREQSLIRTFYESRLAGAIVVGSLLNEAYLDWPHRNAMPIVLIGSPAYPFSVGVDNARGAYLAIAHLLQLGHTRIVFVTQGHRTNTEQQRLDGYTTALAERDILVDNSLIVHGDGNITGGVSVVAQILAIEPRPTAVFCYNDMTAIGVINGLQQHGIHVPQDISVVGFDDLSIASAYAPSLTTMRQPTARLGQAAISTLQRLSQECQQPAPQVFEPTLVVRQSTAPRQPDVSRG